MLSLITLLQGTGLAYAAGLNLYATVAVTGLAVRLGWVQHVPTTIEPFANLFVIGLALVFYVIEFIATLVPGVASAWETLHSLIRPPAAAVLAAATAWHADPVIVLIAALAGGGSRSRRTPRSLDSATRSMRRLNRSPTASRTSRSSGSSRPSPSPSGIIPSSRSHRAGRAGVPDDAGATHLARAAAGDLGPLDARAWTHARSACDGTTRRADATSSSRLVEKETAHRFGMRRSSPTCKPGSVRRLLRPDDHFSRSAVAHAL